jgi:mannose-6-phosphate isomerase-like protein (cupin superfamily)
LSEPPPTDPIEEELMTTRTYLAFDQNELEKRFESAREPYNEFLRRRGMSLGMYMLPAGGTDAQHPHMADEVYIVMKGRGTLRVADDEVEVGPGSIVSVDHGEEHRFVNIAENLHMLVVFAPPDVED